MPISDESVQDRDSPRLVKLRSDLKTWLSQKDWSNEELRRWIKGYALPPFGYEEEPYIWILRGLAGIPSQTQEMARRVALFLKTESPGQYLSASWDDKFLYNLFYLCSELGCKDELARPLAGVFHYFSQGREAERDRVFSLTSHYNLSGAFRDALIANQVDRSYVEVWKAILEERDGFLSTHNPFQGFRGILYLDEPDVDEIGWALKKMADYLEPDNKRYQKFRDLLQRVKTVWGPEKTHYDWDEVFFRQAMKHRWQNWARVELGNTALSIGSEQDGMKHYFIWDLYAYLLEESGLPFNLLSKDGIFLEINASKEADSFLREIAPAVEQVRLACPWRTYRSVRVASHDRLLDFETEFELKGETGKVRAIEKARRRILVDIQQRRRQPFVKKVLARGR